jgi:DNA-binding transcriptional ArsR family regulator
MSRRSHKGDGVGRRSYAPVFAALGDATRLALVSRLSDGGARSISELTAGARMTRQAVTKHLRVLERAGIVRGRRAGRERVFLFRPAAVLDARRYLEMVAAEWDRALGRLKAFVEG